MRWDKGSTWLPPPLQNSQKEHRPLLKPFKTVICLFILLADYFNYCHQLSLLTKFFFFFFNKWNLVNFRKKLPVFTFYSNEYHLEISTQISTEIFCSFILIFFFSKIILKIRISFWNWADSETERPELLLDLHFWHVGWKVAELCTL